jgi:hypothetical protein
VTSAIDEWVVTSDRWMKELGKRNAPETSTGFHWDSAEKVTEEKKYDSDDGQ